MVNKPKPPTIKNKEPVKTGLKRNNKYTPAVTNVEECTRADTGVGAAMAAGNHLLNGY
jgi:hypothetical protein